MEYRSKASNGQANNLIIAIDGPAGAGKSTTARGVARRLGFIYLETGAMYRAVTLAFLETGTPLEEEAGEELLDRIRIDLKPTETGVQVLLDDVEVSARLRSPRVDEAVSDVSRLRVVRERMVDLQRKIGRRLARDWGGVVAEGRDTGTVVFPEAAVKIFMVADIRERARRRLRDLRETNPDLSIEAVIESIEERDRRDAQRAVGPLQKAEDAIELDTTGLSVEEQIDEVIAYARERESL